VLFGTLLALTALEAGMRIVGYAVVNAQDRDNSRRLKQQHQLRVMCLGESTTAGNAGVPRYPEILQDMLNRQGLDETVVVINMGRSGAVTRDIMARLEADIAAFKPHIVVAMMGINDGGKTHAYGTIIEPGRGHWYGDFRLYKLYRLLRHALSTGRPPSSVELGEGIRQPTPGVDAAFVRPGPTPPEPTPQKTDDARFLEQVRKLIDTGDLDAARSLLEPRLSRDPDFADGYVELARVYAHGGDPERAHTVLLRGAAAAAEPSILLQSELAMSYDARGETDRAIAMIVEIRRELLQPSNLVDHTHQAAALANLYEKSGQLEAAERTLKEIAEQMNPGHAGSFDELIAFYERNGRPEDAQHFREIRRRVRYEYVNPETRRNYLNLEKVLRSDGIPLIAVQYPGRDVREVRRLLAADPWPIYVDNSFFNELVEKNGFDTYYIDRFGGDFGHLTGLGNCLLAENIARVIVERLFEREFSGGTVTCQEPGPSTVSSADTASGDLVGRGLPN
jgi:tetratricopeptide (TPR) repeat protein